MKTIVSELMGRFSAALLLALALAAPLAVAQSGQETRFGKGYLDREQLSYTNAVRDAANDLRQAIDRFERQKFDLSEQSLLRAQVWLDVTLKLLENHRPRISQVIPPLFSSQKSTAEKLMQKYLGIRNRIYSLQNEVDTFLPQLEAKLGRKSLMIQRARDLIRTQTDPNKIKPEEIINEVNNVIDQVTGDSAGGGGATASVDNGAADQLQKLLKAAGLSDSEIQKFMEMFNNLSPEQQQALLKALAGLSPQERAKIARALAQLTPEEFAKVAAALAKMSPQDAQKALRELAKLTPQQAATALRAIAGLSAEDAQSALETLANGSAGDKKSVLQQLGVTGSGGDTGGAGSIGAGGVKVTTKDGTEITLPGDSKIRIGGKMVNASDIKRSEVKREYIDEIGGQINKEEFRKLVVSADGKEGEYVSDGVVNWALDIVEVSKDGNKITYKVENAGDAGDQFKIERWELTVGSNKRTEGSGATFTITAPEGDFSVTAFGRTAKGDNEFRITKNVSQI